jgi:small-conductance mechanosensitive channel
MLDFVTQIDDFILAVVKTLEQNLVHELVTAASLVIILAFLIVAQKKVRSLISKRVEKNKSLILLLNDLVFPGLYLIIIYIAKDVSRGAVSLIIFNSIAFLYFGYMLFRNLLRPLSLDNLPWNLSSYILLLIATLGLALLNLNDKYFASPELEEVLLLIFKTSVIALIYIILFRGLRSIREIIPEKLDITKGVLDNFVSILSVIYIIIAALWVLKLLGFASSYISGVVLCFVAITFYAFVKTYIATYLTPKIEEQEQRYQGLSNNINFFLTLILVYVLFKVFEVFFNIGFAVHYLSNLYIIKTDLFGISLFSAITGIFTFLVLLSLVGILKHWVYYYYISRNKEVEAGSLRAIVSNLGLLLIIIICLSNLGFTWKALLPVAGALGIGVGFGLQSIMNNYLSGFILLFSRKLKVGDIVEIEGNAGRAIGNKLETIYGRVNSIDVLSTVVSTTDGIEVVVPNSQFITEEIVNYSLSDNYIRVRIPFGVSYSSDPNAVREILLSIAKEHSQILKYPAPGVWFSQMADSALIFELLIWVNIRMLWKINPIVSEIYFKGWDELQHEGIVVPFPQRDVWFKNNLKIELKKEIPEDLGTTEDETNDT